MSRGGIIPISHSQDTAGPMARTVADAADAARRARRRRPAATPRGRGQRARGQPTTRASSIPTGCGARASAWRAPKYFGYSDATALAEEALEVLQGEGAILVDPANIRTAAQHDDAELDGAAATSSRPTSTPTSRARLERRRSRR